MKAIKTLEVRTRSAWERWLKKHHASEPEIWLVFYKRHAGVRSLEHKDALDEALCYGWIDSLVRRLDDDRYAVKFTPRKPDSRWSAVNRKRYAELAEAGQLKPPGVARAPTDRVAEKPGRYELLEIPKYIRDAIAKNRAAQTYFDTLAPGYRRNYVGWIDSAKQDATKQRRLAEAVATLATGRKLGLK